MNKCLICGCTDNNCNLCVERTGEPCYWVDKNKNLCSACSEEATERIGFLNYVLRRLEKASPLEIVRMLHLKRNEIHQTPFIENKSFEHLDEESSNWFQWFKKFDSIKKQDNVYDIASVRLLNLLTAHRDHLELNIVKKHYLPINELSKISLKRFTNCRNVGQKTVWELKAICYYAQVNLKL